MLIFLNVMLPVLLMFASGFILQAFMHLEIKPISTLAMYLLLPFLVFKIFYQQELNANFGYIFLILLLILGVLIILGLLVAKVFKFSSQRRNAFLLATIFSNSGNFGIPLAMFAYGNRAMQYAMPIMVIHTLFMSFVGIYIAASGSGKGGIKDALASVLRQPMNYAIIPGILCNQLTWEIPSNLMKWVNMISKTAIPIIMLTLGMQLYEVIGKKINWSEIAFASVVKLLVAPLIAWVLCGLFPISPLLKSIVIIMTAMPSAANTTIYAIQYGSDPQYVSACTFATTILSFLSLTLLLNILI
ncbi:MAG: AEC family transporter [Clostridia bacterium]|nr:AEC family transporter [Clostridia bacterium]